jgi:hypothetical protein
MSVHSRYFRLSYAALALSLAACAEGVPLEPESTRTALEPPLEEPVGSGTGGTAATPDLSAGAAGAGGTFSNMMPSADPALPLDDGSGSEAGGSGGGGAGANVDETDAGVTTEPAAPIPTGIVLEGGQATPLEAPSPGGSAYSQLCAEDEVLIGYQGTRLDSGPGANYLRSFEAVCGALSITQDGSYSIAIDESQTLAQVGVDGAATTGPVFCPAGQAIVGFSGNSGGYIDHLVFHCAPLTLASTADGYVVSLGTATPQPTILGGPSGNPFAAKGCPPGQIAVGNSGRSGLSIDAFGLLCGTPEVTTE